MHTYNKLYKSAHVGTIFIVLFVVCVFLFQHSVFATVYVSKETMKSCFDKYGSDENVLQNCFLAFSTTKNEEKTKKYNLIDEQSYNFVGEEQKLINEKLQNFINKTEKKKQDITDKRKKAMEIAEKSGSQNLIQDTYNTDVLEDRNVDISKMSEQEACEYLTKVAGYWNKDNNTCVPSGGSLWMANWNRDAKMFECLNIFDAAEKWRDAQWREEQKSWLESYRKHIYDDKGNLKPAVIGLQWDRNFGKCTSEIERQCIANGDTYDWFGTCYKHENNKKTCIDIIGGKWKDENGQESCECNIGQYDMLSWTPQKCQYKILLKQENSSANYIDQQNTGPHKYSDTIPLEYCFEKYKDGFLNNQLSETKSKLNCK